jgi:hypothetical protein
MADAVREFLESAKWAHAKAARLLRKVKSLETQVEHITPSYSGMPGGSGGDSSKAWVALAQLRDDYGKELVLAAEQERRVAEFVESLPTPVYREVLSLRYCEGLHWSEVIERMKEAGLFYEDRYVYRLHGRALNEAREKWKELHHDESRDS